MKVSWLILKAQKLHCIFNFFPLYKKITLAILISINYYLKCYSAKSIKMYACGEQKNGIKQSDL